MKNTINTLTSDTSVSERLGMVLPHMISKTCEYDNLVTGVEVEILKTKLKGCLI